MKSLPNIIPIFPLSGVIYFPKTNLPLNIFERRYLDLVNDTYSKDKLMGMVQSQKNGKAVYKVGCLGKIVSFNETDDRRFIINLSGIIRFRIKDELETKKLYREFNVDYSDFMDDLSIKETDKEIHHRN